MPGNAASGSVVGSCVGDLGRAGALMLAEIGLLGACSLRCRLLGGIWSRDGALLIPGNA